MSITEALADGAVLLFALALALLFGEPAESIHPTVWMGKAIEKLAGRARPRGRSSELAEGILLGVSVILLFAIPTFFLVFFLNQYLGVFVYILVAAVILKTTIALKSMGQFTIPIADAIERGDYDNARKLLSRVVRRDTSRLDEQHILSATVETIAEGTVDGITGSLFLFSLLGAPGAVIYRVSNTLDSMVGYKDRAHLYLGWFSARLDTALNYFPARLVGILTPVSAFLLGLDWRNSLTVVKRDGRTTESVNAGWSMAAMAGALGVNLEKLGAYSLGEPLRPLGVKDVSSALSVMRTNVILFSLVVCLPLIALSGAVLPLGY